MVSLQSPPLFLKSLQDLHKSLVSTLPVTVIFRILIVLFNAPIMRHTAPVVPITSSKDSSMMRLPGGTTTRTIFVTRLWAHSITGQDLWVLRGYVFSIKPKWVSTRWVNVVIGGWDGDAEGILQIRYITLNTSLTRTSFSSEHH